MLAKSCNIASIGVVHEGRRFVLAASIGHGAESLMLRFCHCMPATVGATVFTSGSSTIIAGIEAE